MKYEHLSALLKATSAVALLLALTAPTMVVPRHLPIGAVVLVYTSTAITPAQIAYATSIANSVRDDKGTQWNRVVYANGSGTPSVNNLARALHAAAALVPDGYSPRALLITDGNAAVGDLSRAILALQQMHIAVDTTPLTPESVALQSIAVPDQVYSGERFAVEMTVNSPRDAAGQIEISLGSGKSQAQSVHLQRGQTIIRAQQRTFSTGAVLLTGKVSVDGVDQAGFARLLQVSRASIAYLSPESSGPKGDLLRILRIQGAAVAQKTSLSRDSLAGVQLMVLSNHDLAGLTALLKDQAAEYVRDGGGLLLLGGEEHPYKEDGQMDALDRVLPASPAPPENSGDKCVVVLIDKSSSMEGKKIRMARQSVLAIADTLSSQDTVGVLAFDHSFRWVVPIQRFRDRRAFLHEVSNLSADGGTEIPPALSAAYHAALTSKAKYRHLVLVTDGISEEGESVQLAKEASQQGIAISTVGIGTAVNRSFLEAVARASGGRSYFLATPEDLKKITLQDVRDYTGSNSVDRPSRPVVRQRRGILDGVDMLRTPSLARYTRYAIKPGAEDVLGVGKAGSDPFYVRWQSGLGRVGLFTSDAIGEWAASWREPAGFDQLWANLARDLYSRAKTTEVVATAPPGHAAITIKYSLGPRALRNPVVPTILVQGPSGFSKAVSLQETSPGSYAAQVSIGDQSGIFRILPEPSSQEFPPTALLVQQQGDLASGRQALRQIAEQTGGKYFTDPASRPVWKAKPVERNIDLWPALVGLAITLNIVELAWRRKRLSLQALLRPRRRETFSTIES